VCLHPNTVVFKPLTECCNCASAFFVHKQNKFQKHMSSYLFPLHLPTKYSLVTFKLSNFKYTDLVPSHNSRGQFAYYIHFNEDFTLTHTFLWTPHRLHEDCISASAIIPRVHMDCVKFIDSMETCD
jgi:hypothetical protein